MNTKTILRLLPLLLLIGLISSCDRQPRIVIGASMGGSGDWSNKLYDEIKTASLQRRGVTIDFRLAHEDYALQERQVDSLIDAHVDILIISPSAYECDARMLRRAKAAGIPVVIVDRQTKSKEYTAYIGRDDEQLGRMMGDYLGKVRRGSPTNILEVAGGPYSSPTIDRGRGFREAIAKYPNLHIVATVGNSWKPDSITKRGVEFLQKHPNIRFNCVVGQSDICAMSMRKAIEQVGGHKGVEYYGVDGLPGPKGGLKMVQEGKLEATVINPTRGFQVVDLAMRILNGKPYKRTNLLHTTVVDKDNIDVVMTQDEMIRDQQKQLDMQNNMILHFYEQYKHQRIYLIPNAIILVLVIVSFVFFHRITVLSRQMIVKEVTLRLEHYMELQTLQSRQGLSDNKTYDTAESHFMKVLIGVIMSHINEPGLNAVVIAGSMGITPKQLTSTLKRISHASLDQIIAITRKFVTERKVKVELP